MLRNTSVLLISFLVFVNEFWKWDLRDHGSLTSFSPTEIMVDVIRAKTAGKAEWSAQKDYNKNSCVRTCCISLS